MKKDKKIKYEIYIDYDKRIQREKLFAFFEVLGSYKTSEKILKNQHIWVNINLPALGSNVDFRNRKVLMVVNTIKDNLIKGDIIAWQVK